MGYSIAYNSGTTTPFGTFKQGPITMGLKPDEYTVSSGFTWYANAEYTNDAYLIISDTYSQGWSTQAEAKPTIWRSETGTTESFVSLVNQLPDVNGVTGFTDSGEAMEYLQNTGKYFVSKDDYLGIVSDGLILNLDAGWYPSYSGSGTTWKDIKGTNNGTLTNGPTFSSDNGGSIVFDGSNDYVDCGNTVGNFGTSNFTLSAWVKTTSTNRAILAKQVVNGWNGFNFFINSSGKLQPTVDWSTSQQFRYIVSNTSVNTGNWVHCVFVLNGADTTNWKIYINGISDSFTESGVDLTGTGINNTTLLTLARREYNDSGTLTGNIANVAIYNRALSADEIAQNYNATKGRFGL